MVAKPFLMEFLFLAALGAQWFVKAFLRKFGFMAILETQGLIIKASLMKFGFMSIV